MATTLRHRKEKDFDIHEDGPYTEDTEMDTDAIGDDAEAEAESDEAYTHHARKYNRHDHDDQHEGEVKQEADEDDEAEADMSDEDVLDDDMRKLQDAFRNFKHKYRLIKRIGEGESALFLCPSPLLCSCCYVFPCACTDTPPTQEHFLPFTKPKTCSTSSTITSGISTRRTRSGYCRLLGSASTEAPPLPPSTPPPSSLDHAAVQNT